MEGTKQESLKRALKKEEDEKSFYLKAASGAKSLLAKRMFEELALEEDAHGKRVLEIYETLKKDAAFKQWTTMARGPSRIEAVFQEISPESGEGCADDLCALQTGLEMEEESIKHYEILAQATNSTYEKRFYLDLAHEERAHYLHIMDAIQYLSDPVGWLYIHQKSMVDGG
jgi:rubrerythrin